MALEIKLSQKLSQTLVMTPQLQQAIKLLQLGRLDYLQVIERELLSNPVLEDAREQSEEIEDQARTATDQSNTKTADSDSIEEGALPGDYFGYSANRSSGFDTDRNRSFVESTVQSPEGLSTHLLWQLRTSELSNEDEDIASQIVGNLDLNGYLSAGLAEIAELCQRSVEDVERVLKIIQSLDPVGIAARDLRECLLIQLEHLGQYETLAWHIVSTHLSAVEHRQFESIASSQRVSTEDVYSAIKEIQKLEPRPGRPFVDEMPVYITPDVYVRKIGEDYVIALNENGLPRLRLNPEYQRLLDTKVPVGSDKSYLQEKLRAAAWLIKSIEQRQQTIYRVTESIMKHQREFLERGVSEMRPLVLREIAADVGLHESTISRVTTNKYVHTPQGVYELKFFFSSGLKTGSGEVSSESVKRRILELIGAENPKKPISDQIIADILKEEGVDIARRTVAKYREMMKILSSSRRKKMF